MRASRNCLGAPHLTACCTLSSDCPISSNSLTSNRLKPDALSNSTKVVCSSRQNGIASAPALRRPAAAISAAAHHAARCLWVVRIHNVHHLPCCRLTEEGRGRRAVHRWTRWVLVTKVKLQAVKQLCASPVCLDRAQQNE